MIFYFDILTSKQFVKSLWEKLRQDVILYWDKHDVLLPNQNASFLYRFRWLLKAVNSKDKNKTRLIDLFAGETKMSNS